MSDIQNNKTGEGVEENNLRKLLSKAYQPERPDQAFADQVERLMQQAAVEQASKVKAPSPRRTIMLPTQWLSAMAAAAACIVLGLSAYLIWQSQRPVTPVDRNYAGSIPQFPAWDPGPRLAAARQMELANSITPKKKEPGKPAEAIAVGATVQTGQGERKRLALPDGSILYVNQNTQLSVSAARKVELAKGRVYVEVSPRPADDPAGRFVVATAQRQVTAMGTRFEVSADEKKTNVVVTQGKVAVRPASESSEASSTLVQAGRQLSAGADGEKVSPAPPISQDLDWTADLMAEADSPLVPAPEHAGGALVAVDPNGQEMKLSLRKYHVDVHVEDGFARTTIDQTYFNHENRRLEGTFYFPLPPDASLSRLAMYVNGELNEGGMAERDYARQVYESIVTRMQDPALLEWVDGSTFKMRVFPLEARQEKRIILSYVQRLEYVDGQAAYRFPGGHTLEYVGEWSFHARVKGGADMNVGSDAANFSATKEGNDLVMDAQAKNVKLGEDLVMRLADNAQTPPVRFSAAEHEGNRYLMLRYRPTLPDEPTRQRRDWVFLFESSADRNPLLARAQIDILRNILENAEHGDMFSVLSANTRVHAWSDSLVSVSAENIASAVEYLEKTHLVGALDLEAGLVAAGDMLKGSENAQIVHLGSGTAVLGAKADDQLVSRIPEGVKYIGVGVGKRWARGFMKTAAGRSGGYFTQINPDENIPFKAMELVSTLNRPRLIGVRVNDESALRGTAGNWLGFNDSARNGEEIAAVTRVAPAEPFPKQVVVTGMLDGKPYTQTFTISEEHGQADYLPRMWAKAEIDRMVAEGADANHDRIVALSKTMYVMSPFTSLLVLENEQMYKQYNVDRGRKDHWAMYPAPAKIKVVTEPLAGQPVPAPVPDAVKSDKPTCQQIVGTIIVRTPPSLVNQNNWRNYIQYETRFGGALEGEGRPIWRSDINGAVRVIDASGVLNLNSVDEDAMRRMSLLRQEGALYRTLTIGGGAVYYDGALRPDIQIEGLSSNLAGTSITARSGPVAVPPPSLAPPPSAVTARPGEVSVRMPVSTPLASGIRGDALSDRIKGMGVPTRAGAISALPSTQPSLAPSAWNMQTAKAPGPAYKELGVDEFRRSSRGLVLGTDLWAMKDYDGKYRQGADAGWMYSGAYDFDDYLAPEYWPGLSGDYRYFSDLLAFAPGMNSSQSDISAVLEKEASDFPQPKVGKIDDAARKLIEAARRISWRKITITPEISGDDRSFDVVFDGSGCFTYQRRLDSGLVEQVYCDGETLWHLYGELGVGAKRTFSRYHRSDFESLVPLAVSPADEYARGADVIAIDAHTIAIVPLREKEDTRASMQLRMTFADDGSLARRQWVRIDKDKDGKTSEKVVYTQEISASGDVKYSAGGDKSKTLKYDQKPVSKPSMSIDESLVIVPMPIRANYRTAEGEKLDTAKLTTDEALKVIISNLDSHPDLAWRVIGLHFAARGDRRIGFYTLMLSLRTNWSPGDDMQWYTGGKTKYVRFDPQKDCPDNPLADYIAEMAKMRRGNYREMTSKVADVGTFTGNIAELYNLMTLWQNGQAGRTQNKKSSDFRRVANFLAKSGWTGGNSVALMFPWNYVGESLLSEIWNENYFALQKADLSLGARYRFARSLYCWPKSGSQSGDYGPAQKLYRELFEEQLARGQVPYITNEMYGALAQTVSGVASDQTGLQLRTSLVKKAVDLLVERGDRLGIANLARRLWQFGDQAQAEELLTKALDGADGQVRGIVQLAMIHFFSQTGRYDRASMIAQGMVKEKQWENDPWLLRICSTTAANQGKLAQSLKYMEKALEIEFANMPDVVNLQAVRQDYQSLMGQYVQVATALSTLDEKPSTDLTARVVRAADRWRSLDTDDQQACMMAARALQSLGQTDLAWDYMTTPLAMKPNEASPWLGMAASLRQEGQYDLASKAYSSAFAAEGSNAQILWDWAQMLQMTGKNDQARDIYRKIANTDWQPKYQYLKNQAKQYAGN